MKMFRMMLAVVIVLSAPTLKGYAAIPDMPFAIKDGPSSNQLPLLEDHVDADSFFEFTPLDVTPSGLVAKVVEWAPTIDATPVDGAAKTSALAGRDDELIQELITDLDAEGADIQGEESSWYEKNKNVVWIGGLLLLTGLLVGLVALFMGGGGSGSGSGGSGGGSGSGSGGSESGTTPFLGGGAGVGDGGAGGSGDTPFGKSFPGTIPVNPEPSTLLLTGLGLLIPYLRKKH